MAKSPKFRRKKRNIRRTVYKGQSELSVNVIKKHNKTVKYVIDNFNLSCINVTSQIMGKAFDKLYFTVFNSSNVFLFNNFFANSYEGAIDNYKTIISIFNNPDTLFNNTLNNDIFKGIAEILLVRLNEYDEEIKPLNMDKEVVGILNDGMKGFLTSIREIVKFKFPVLVEIASEIALKNKWDITEENLEGLLEDIKWNGLNIYNEEVYNYYINYVNLIIERVNKKVYRDALSVKLDLMKEEYEILSSVIKIQIPELEASENDDEIVQQILYLVRETYQHLGKSIETLEEIYLKTIEEDEIILSSIEEFKNEISIDILANGLIDEKEFYTKYNVLKEDFKNKFTASVVRVLNLVENELNIPNLKSYREEMINEDADISKEISNMFLKTIKYTKDNTERLNAFEEYNIIDGIKETIDIKIQNIDENLDYYKECLMNKVIITKAQSLKEIADNKFSELFEIWKEDFHTIIDYNYEQIAYVNNFFNTNVNNKFKEIKPQYEKKLKMSKDDIDASSNNYKKETLLFEVSTFEEVINYSISKIRENNNAELVSYCNYVEKIYTGIQNILLKYNIKQINPEPKSPFNAKEHEVLMAKEEEGYQKGTVIKVLNKGYFRNDKILLRANIIAAK